MQLGNINDFDQINLSPHLYVMVRCEIDATGKEYKYIDIYTTKIERDTVAAYWVNIYKPIENWHIYTFEIPLRQYLKQANKVL